MAGYRECVIALLLAAVAVGLSNLAASIGIGVTGVTAKTRLQVSLVFGVFESGMPIVGLLIGQRIASNLGQAVQVTFEAGDDGRQIPMFTLVD